MKYPTGYGVASGRVEVCVNGEYVDVCPGSISAQAVCAGLEYAGTVERNTECIMHTESVTVMLSSGCL